MERKKVLVLLATPMSRASTLFWAISIVVCISCPMPMPSTIMYSAKVVLLVCVSSNESRTTPTVRAAPPRIGYSL